MLNIVNTQEPERVDRKPDGTLEIHSIFKTIQGEGPFAGRAALFIRLAGCNLQCPGCDTEYTRGRQAVAPVMLLHLVESWNDWPKGGLIVITGGEPFRQNLIPAVEILLQDYKVQIETNGVLYPGDAFPWHHPNMTVVCSPKTGKIHPKTAHLVNAYKYVLSWGGVAPDGLPVRALNHPLAGSSTVARPPVGWGGPIYVQPMDVKDAAENEKNIKAVVQSVMQHKKYIMGVQMHKLTGLP